MLDESVGERVARLRERRHMTQAQLSDATDGAVSEAWIAAVEKNRLKMPPNLEKLRALASPLGVSYAYLLEPLDLAPLGEEKAVDWEALLDALPLDEETRQAIAVVIRRIVPPVVRKD